MTRTSSRHKSHKHSSKHSSRDYSDSEEDVKMKRSYRDENPVRPYRDSASGEKRKVSSQVKDGKDPSGHGNGLVLKEYVVSKRRKEKFDVFVGGDRWNGGVEQRGDVENETSQRESMKMESKSRESIGKGESLKIDSKSRECGTKCESLKIDSKSREGVTKGESLIESKSKRYETGERKDDNLESVVLDKYENKSRGESKRKSEKDSSVRKEKESKEKEHKLEKEKVVGQESKHVGDEAKFVDIVVGKKHVSQSVDINDDKQGKRSRSNTERASERNPELEKESEKRIHKRREVSSERDKYLSDFKEAHERRLSSKGDPAKETKYRDDKQKDASYSDKHRDDKNREDGDKEVRHKDDIREDSNREHRRKDEKHREDGERDKRRKDDKYREGTEREHRDDKYHDDTDREHRHKDDRYRVDGDKDNRKDERYYNDGERDDRRRYDGLREDGDRDNRQKDEKHREDTEQDTRHKDRKSGDDLDREKRHRNSKYRDEYEYNSRDRCGDKSDPPKGDSYAADHNSRKSSVYDDSSTHEDRTVRFRDDQSRRKTNEKEDYGDVRYGSRKDQRSNAEIKTVNGAGMDAVPERGRSASRNADIELNSSHGRRRNSPGSSSHDTRDQFRVPKQDESKYREINYEERVRHSTSSTREYTGTGGGSEKTSPWSLDKHGKKGDGHLGELSAERRLKSDIRPSPLQLVDKSPSSSADKRRFSRPDRRSADFRDANEYSGKESRTSRELPMNVINGDEFSKADTGALSVSSPFTRNSHFSNSSKLFPPPHFRTGMDSPLPLNWAEDESRGKSNNRQRRIVDPNMGRMQGNAWGGMPSWPSPMSNGFLPFPHAPPPLNFMQPFPSPPIFGVRPSMDLNHSLSSPYHSGQVHNMGWRNQVGDSFSGWDASNSGFVDESHNYGRPNWDISRNLNGNLWKGQNRSVGLEMPSSDKENNSTRSGDEALVGEATKSQQTQAEEQAESAGISQSSRSVVKNDIDSLVVNQEEAGDVDNSSRKGDLCLSHVYLSRLDISVDLVEPEIFDKCTGLIDLDESMFFDLDGSKILSMKEAVEAKTAPHHEILSCTLFPSADDTIFQKAMSLYKRHRDNFKAEVVEKLKILNTPITDQEDQNVEYNEESEKLTPTDYMQGVEDSLTNIDMEVNPPIDLLMLEVDVETSQQKIDPLADNAITEKSEEGVSVKVSNDSLSLEVKEVPAASGNDTKSGPFLNNDDVSSEVEAVVIQESVVSNLSRIHHSPESTH